MSYSRREKLLLVDVSFLFLLLHLFSVLDSFNGLPVSAHIAALLLHLSGSRLSDSLRHSGLPDLFGGA